MWGDRFWNEERVPQVAGLPTAIARRIATVEDPAAVRQILAARRPAETLGPGPPAGAPAMAN